MRHLIIIMILISSITLRLNAQGCLPEGVKFTTQEQVDNFQLDFPNCSVIEGYLELNGTDISNLTGLSSINTVMGDLIINGTNITNLEGLENLIKIGSDLIIISNDMLVNLSALENLDSICRNLTIGWNDLINSLSGIDNINSESIQNLYFRANKSLTECDIQSICIYLASPNGTVSIYDNATGCNSREEVENLCQTSLQDNLNSKFSIFPNPATKVVCIKTINNEPIQRIIIYNQYGQIIQRIKQDINQINTSNLQHGIYVIEIEINDKVYRDILIIK